MDFDYKWFSLWVDITGLLLLFAFGFLIFVVQRRYIVKRFEVETNLAETDTLLMLIARPWIMMFPFLKAACYSSHLFVIMFITHKVIKNKNDIYFKDSPSREEILSHFSRKELVLTAVTMGCAFLGMAILVISCLLDWLWRH